MLCSGEVSCDFAGAVPQKSLVASAVRLVLLLVPCLAQLVRRELRPQRLVAALRSATASVPAERVLYVEESLRGSYEAFPKDGKGNLPPHQALPALARAYFAKEHGWLVRGLETPGAPIIGPGESSNEATAPHQAGELYEVHLLKVRRAHYTHL